MDHRDLITLGISLRTALVATALTTVGGLAAAWLMAFRSFRGKVLVEGLFLAPLVLPPTVVGFLLLLLLGTHGPLGKAAQLVLGNTLLFSWPAAVLAATVVSFPLMYRTAKGAFEQVDRDVLSAARTLGASEPGVFFRVGLAAAWPGIVAGVVLAFARALGEFGATLMIAGNLPGRTRTIPLAIYSDVESGALAHAGMWVLLVSGVTLVIALAANALAKRPLLRRRRRPPAARPEVPLPSAAPAGAGPVSSLEARVLRSVPGFRLDVAFAIRRKACAVIGPSGAGKSMLLRCLAGLERPEAGSIALDGVPLFDASSRRFVEASARRIGYVFQNYALFEQQTVYENVAFGIHGLAENERRARIWKLLDATGLADCAGKFPRELSGGQQQRVAIARALATGPRLLLLDEPLSALDTHLRYRLERFVLETVHAFSGKTILVTHNLDEAFRICDELVVLDEGRIVAAGDKHDVFSRPGTVRAAIITGCKNISRTARGSAPGRVLAADWGCELPTDGLEDSGSPTHLGIRAHHLVVTPHDGAETPGSFACWPSFESETAHRVTMHLKIGAPPKGPSDHHLQVELSKERGQALRAAAPPWRARFPPERLMPLTEPLEETPPPPGGARR